MGVQNCAWQGQISSTMVSIRHESCLNSALSIGVENDAIEEENALSHLEGIVS